MRDARQPCPICRTDAVVGWLLEKSGYPLYHCADCDHIFVAPQPSPEELARIYSFDAGYQRQEAVRFEELSEFPAKFETSLSQIRRHVPRGKLLDVGSSSGRLLYLARQRGYEVQGVELNPDTAAIARANDLPTFVGTLEDAPFEAESFDAIHLGDVIEHVPAPDDLLRRVRRLLRPGGVALVVTPNHDAFFARATRRLMRLGIPWSHPTPPFHLNQFSVGSLTRLMRRTGLRVVEEAYTPCSLRYELRATGAFKPLREALQARRFPRIVGRGLFCSYVTAAYVGVWLADRALPLKKRDCTMRLVAAPDAT